MLELHVERTDAPSLPPLIKKFSTAEIFLGRAPESDLHLDDPSVSRRHCRLARSASGWTLEDLGSANGTLIDDERIEGVHPIPPDAVITTGNFRLTLHTPSLPLAPPRRPPILPRKLLSTTLAITVACVSGWASADLWDTPLRLPIAATDCPRDDPSLLALETTLARAATMPAEEALQTILTARTSTSHLPTICALHPRVDEALTAALARMDHRRLGRHSAPIQTVLPVTDDRIAAIDHDGRLMLWRPAHRGQQLQLDPPAEFRSLARSADDRWLASGTDDGRITLWDVHAADLTATTLPHGPRSITAVQFTANHLWTIDDAGTLHTWTLTDTWTRTASAITWPGIHTLTALPDGRMLAFGAERAAVIPQDLRRPLMLTTGAALRTVAVDGNDIIAGDLAGKVTRWRLGRTVRPEPLTAHGGPIRALAIRDGLVASIGEDDALRLLELGRRVRRSGPPLVLLTEVPVPVDRLVITGTTLVGSGSEGALVSWDLSQRTRRLPATVHDAHRGPVSALATTRTAAISGGDDGILRTWPTTTIDESDTPPLTRACIALNHDAPGCDE